MTKSVFISVPFEPRDRAALARMAHNMDMSPGELLHALAVKWLHEKKLRTVTTPETTAKDNRPQLRKRSVPSAENQNKFDVI